MEVVWEADLPLGGGGRLGVVDGDGAVDGAGGEATAAVVPTAARRAGPQLRHLPLRHSPLPLRRCRLRRRRRGWRGGGY